MSDCSEPLTHSCRKEIGDTSNRVVTYVDVSISELEQAEHSSHLRNHDWYEINEAIESDFPISPGNIYPNRKVQLEDADIKETTFDLMCKKQHEAFSKKNKDIGHTQLIEMEIDT